MRKIIEIPVGDLMSAPALTVKPETTIDELTRLFAEHEFNGLPVVNEAMALMVDYRIRTIPVVNDAAGGKVVVGVVTRRDLMAALKA